MNMAWSGVACAEGDCSRKKILSDRITSSFRFCVFAAFFYKDEIVLLVTRCVRANINFDLLLGITVLRVRYEKNRTFDSTTGSLVIDRTRNPHKLIKRLGNSLIIYLRNIKRGQKIDNIAKKSSILIFQNFALRMVLYFDKYLFLLIFFKIIIVGFVAFNFKSAFDSGILSPYFTLYTLKSFLIHFV